MHEQERLALLNWKRDLVKKETERTLNQIEQLEATTAPTAIQI